MIGRRHWELAMDRHAWGCVAAVLSGDITVAATEARKADLAHSHWRETCENELFAEMLAESGIDVESLPVAEPPAPDGDDDEGDG